eukprot:2694178-Rhodomonas_salina.3
MMYGSGGVGALGCAGRGGGGPVSESAILSHLFVAAETDMSTDSDDLDCVPTREHVRDTRRTLEPCEWASRHDTLRVQGRKRWGVGPGSWVGRGVWCVCGALSDLGGHGDCVLELLHEHGHHLGAAHPTSAPRAASRGRAEPAGS